LERPTPISTAISGRGVTEGGRLQIPNIFKKRSNLEPTDHLSRFGRADGSAGLRGKSGTNRPPGALAAPNDRLFGRLHRLIALGRPQLRRASES
jgi:hypothetical protein